MDAERERNITSIFHAAVARPTDERAAFLHQACAGDEGLRHEVEALLASHDSAGSFIEAPAYERGAGLLAGARAGSLAGQSFGQYRLLSLLGAGGMGEVYLAEDKRLDRRVALKVLPAHLTTDQTGVGRFQQEARAASALNHPNIVTIYEINEAAGTHYIATEYIEGLTLRTRLARGGLALDDALDICVQTASALNAAHSAGVVHRDIKPENVMLRPDGYVKVLDFGIAKLTERQRTAADAEAATRALVQTGKGVVMGTAHYMSPEQARGQTVDARTDIWSLGVVLYELVAGRVPFAGETASDCIASILKTEPAPLTAVAPAAPLRLEWIVQKALRKDRDERYQTAKELLSDLRAVKQEVDASAQAERSVAPDTQVRAGATASSGQQAATNTAGEPISTVAATHTTSSAEYIATEIKRHKLGAVVALAVFVLVIAGVGFALYKYLNRGQAAPPFQNVTISRLTTSGTADDANISPDGKYVAYMEHDADGNESLWVKQTATGNTLQIVAPAKVGIQGTTFSPDGNFIYYVMYHLTEETASLYQVASIGGPSKKVLEDLDSPVAISPDGKRAAFVREERDYKFDLIVANLDGTGARVLASRMDTNWFAQGGPAWSPDGSIIACGAAMVVGGDNSFFLLGVNVETGAVKELSPKRWLNIHRAAWMADGKTILLVANDENDNRHSQIWQVSYPGGEASRITNDLQAKGRGSLGVTADGSTIVTTARQRTSQIWTLPANGDVRAAKQITSGVGQDGDDGLSWTPDGRLVFSSYDGGQSDLWVMNADGSNRQRITSDAYLDQAPAVSPDGRYIVFESYRRKGNVPNLWRMDLDGGNLKELTSVEDQTPHISPDGRQVVYASWQQSQGSSMWQVSIDGGAPVQLTDYYIQGPQFSPDGNWIAFIYYDDQVTPKRWRNGIIPATGHVRPVKLFDRPNIDDQHVQWTPDGRSLSYIGAPAYPENLWLQPVAGGAPKQLTNFKSDRTYHHVWSRDGKQLALARGNEMSDVVLLRATQ
jgi:serine/threonine protein kinase/Tol biopolymer transport system component